jgi:hypothetical protein
MLEVGCCCRRINRRVRKPLGEKAAEARPKLLPRDARGRTRRIRVQKFEAAWFRSPESLHLEHDAVLRLFFDADDAPRQIPFVRPEMNERAFFLVAQLAVKRGKLREPFIVFADFGATGFRPRAQSAV